ncbi:unnamed protein product [Cuscuta epithymum]|uniref:EF-hand domain-containing protein n=1 Tax=Cuscuta epithymum TaxID=186058 RepID=A0AAV0D8F1_9ASTE|nr:unnamed protein product [Cuscuta epithymum]
MEDKIAGLEKRMEEQIRKNDMKFSEIQLKLDTLLMVQPKRSVEEETQSIPAYHTHSRAETSNYHTNLQDPSLFCKMKWVPQSELCVTMEEKVQCTKEKDKELLPLVDNSKLDWETISAKLDTSFRELPNLSLAPQRNCAWKRQAFSPNHLDLPSKKRCTALQALVRSRLQQFAGMNRFKKMALRVIAEHLSAEEVEFIHIAFTLLDTDRDVRITHSELSAGLRKVGSLLDEPEILMLMEVADIDGKGYLDYGEFVAVAIHLQKMEIDEHFQRAFCHFDKNGSSYIELDDLRERLAAKSGEPDAQIINLIMSEVDTDKDGRINFKEFVAMMKTY